MIDERRTRTMSPADDIELHPGFVPEPVMQISSPESLRAISDPTRLRILEVMVQRQDPPWSVKELAAELAGAADPPLPPRGAAARPRCHPRRGAARGLGDHRDPLPRAALSFQLDRRLFEGDADEASRMLHDTLTAVFDTARDEIEAAMRSGAIDPIRRRGHRAGHGGPEPRPSHPGARGRVPAPPRRRSRRSSRARCRCCPAAGRGAMGHRPRGLPPARPARRTPTR